jgi:tetraacyldisaccharide 4'-kinase
VRDHPEPFHVRFVRGETHGPGDLLLRALLAPTSWLFAAAAEARVVLYRSGVFTRHRVPVPVISVGNLTVGGTGKTPLVEWVVSEARLFGRRPAVLSRGYGAKEDETPDELEILSENLLDFLAVRDADRVRGALTAIEDHRADCLVLDDGFQHVRLSRDVDLVTVDATSPFGGNHCLPRGMLREPVRALRRAHGVVLTRTDQVEEGARDAAIRRIRRTAPGAAIALTVHAPKRLVSVGGEAERPPDWLRDRPVYAASGIGNPGAFERTLEALGARVVGRARFPDHQPYDAARLADIASRSRDAGADLIVTTQKDAVKWKDLPEGFPDAVALHVGIEFTSGEESIRALLRAVLGPGRDFARPVG